MPTAPLLGLPQLLVLALTAITVPNKIISTLVFFKNNVDNSAARLRVLFCTKPLLATFDQCKDN